MASIMDLLTLGTPWIVNATLHAAILVILILALQGLLRQRLGARWRHLLWLVLALRLALPCSLESSFSIYNLLQIIPAALQGQTSPAELSHQTPPVSLQTAPLAQSAPPNPTTEPLAPAPALSPLTPTAVSSFTLSPQPADATFTWQHWLAMAWLAGVLFFFIYLFVVNLRVWRALTRQRPLTDQTVLDLFESCKAQMGIHTLVSLVPTDQITGPALFGFVRPRIILPLDLIHRLGPEELRHVFLHELAHLKRRDIYIAWLTAILQAIHWFNPFVWLAFARMRADRELACDSLALTHLGPAHARPYAQTIIRLLEMTARPQSVPALAAILENPSHLKRRIAMITRFQTENRLRVGIAAGLVGIVALATLANARTAPNPTPADQARQVVRNLAAENYTAVVEHFDQTMRKNLPADQLRQTWQQTISAGGPFQKILGTRQERYIGDAIVYVTVRFERGPLDVKLVFNSQERISGFWLVPTPQAVLDNYTQTSQEPNANQPAGLNEAQQLYQDWTMQTFRNLFKEYHTLQRKYRNTASAASKAQWSAAAANVAKALASPNQQDRIQGIIGAAALKDPAAARKLLQIASDRREKDNRDRWLAIWALDRLGHQTGEVVTQLIHLLYHYNQNTRFWAQIALVHLTGQNFGSDWRAWGRWWNDQKGQPAFEPTKIPWTTNAEWADESRQQQADRQFIAKLKQEKTSGRDAAPVGPVPRILHTNPDAFANDVSPSLDKITVTFDRAMMDQSWSWTGGGDTYPQTTGRPFYDDSRTTCTLPVKLEAGKVYWVGINSPSHRNFKTPDRTAANWYIILFATAGADGSPTPLPPDRLRRARQINARHRRP